MNPRIIAIGDIHGCHEEFAELLTLINPTSDDRLILVGDLVNRGPDSCKVIDLARQHRAISILGNHERRLLRAYRRRDPSPLRSTDRETFRSLRSQDWEYLQAMPLFHEEPSVEALFVHGGFIPDKPWRDQSPEVLTNIQVIDDEGQPRKRRDAPEARPWADHWTGPPFVVYGHTPRSEVYQLKWSIGIDTAYVGGGHLTAFILPEGRILQVKAQKCYYS